MDSHQLRVFASQRYEDLERQLTFRGIEIDSGFSLWEYLPEHDPDTAHILLRGIHALDHRRDGPDDQIVVIKLEEWWSHDPEVEPALELRGFGLNQCHYDGSVGQSDPGKMRYCYAPNQFPEEPMHWHPLTAPDQHRRHAFYSADAAIQRFDLFVFQSLNSGFIVDPQAPL